MTCAHCFSPFTPRNRMQRYCCDECRLVAKLELSRLGDEARPGWKFNAPIRTYAEVGAALGLSGQRVEQIEKMALRKLRKRMRREDYR